MNKETKDEIRERVKEIVGYLREKYGDDSSVPALERIVAEELGIPCRGFSVYERGGGKCWHNLNNGEPIGIAYSASLSDATQRYILAHEMGHAFLGYTKDYELKEDQYQLGEYQADEFAEQITGTSSRENRQRFNIEEGLPLYGRILSITRLLTKHRLKRYRSNCVSNYVTKKYFAKKYGGRK